MKTSYLDLTLKGWAAAMLVTAGIAFLQTQAFDIKRIIASHILFFLSLFLTAQPARIAIFSAAFAVVVMIGSARDYLAGNLSILACAVDAVGFGLTLKFVVSPFLAAAKKNK
jgi:mannose/fructose/N-acetylgalactosamine-specific phosphotransferase system component IIC